MHMPLALLALVAIALLGPATAGAQNLRLAAITPPSLARVALLPSAVLALPAPVTPAAGSRLPEEALERWIDSRRVDRLESSLVELAHSDRIVRTWGAAGGLLLGGLVIAGGVAIAVDDEDWGGHGRVVTCALAWSAGAAMVAAAMFRFFSKTPAEDRLLRWSALRQDRKLDVFEFTRFEGELASEAETARFTRRLAAYGSLTLTAGGAATIALAASDKVEGDSETYGYILGGVLAGVGVIQSLTLFLVTTPAEKAWKHYAEGGGGFFSQSKRPHLAF